MLGNSLRDTYITLFQQIATIVDSNNNPIFKNVGIFDNQIERMKNPKTTGSWNLPAIFIEMKVGGIINLGQSGLNAYDINYIIHIVMNNLNVSNPIWGGTMDQNLLIFDLRNMVNQSLLGFSPQNCSAICYVGEKQQFNHTNIYEYILMYTGHYIDNSGVKPVYSATASLVLDIDLYATYSISNQTNIPSYWE